VFLAGIGWPATRNAILHRLNAALTEQKTGKAAKSWWAEQEGFLPRPK
jgi:hypothetical protein